MARRINILRSLRRPSLSTILTAALLLVGSAIIAYPSFADWWNNYHQYRAISDYVTQVGRADQEEIDRLFEEARAYNERLLNNSRRFSMTEAEREEYESTLRFSNTGIIGYVQVPNLGINYPIYHGISEKVLQTAIGHIEGTSLPVGGPNTHAAISGHRGLPSARLFSDLDKMREGDFFTITVLNKTLTYVVDQIRIVEPEDMSDLNFVQNEDYMTLVTCTPYGVNTHRLLVRGHRDDSVGHAHAIPAEAVQIPNYIAVPAVGIPMLFAYLVGALVWYGLRGRAPSHDAAIAALEKIKDGEGRGGGET